MMRSWEKGVKVCAAISPTISAEYELVQSGCEPKLVPGMGGVGTTVSVRKLKHLHTVALVYLRVS